jgi:(1->4)-alpha-D-glucan 1-alpha-D-glucosylmutase
MAGEMKNSVPAKTADEIARRRPLPRATYRLQLNSSFGFRDVRPLIHYWHDLGISDLYVSPIMQACAGSSHGYDICEHGRINCELGGEEDFLELRAELVKHGMGLILDVVPNHMGISDVRNVWWMDVLENGPSSQYASYFDIDWNPVKSELKDKVLLPILEDQYGNVLESGKLQLTFSNGSFYILYGNTRLPVAPRTYSAMLAHRLAGLSESLNSDNPHLQELQSILTALNYLPNRTEQDPEKIVERNREKEVIKRRIAALCESSIEIREAIEATVKEFNGVAGNPHSFDYLDALLASQVYRPAFWKVAAEEINYRRFFDINDLAAIRMENPEVFRATHALVLDLLSSAPITGLRIDHTDGLWDPASYLKQIQLCHAEAAAGSKHPSGATPAEIAAAHSREYSDQPEAGISVSNFPLYVIVEKILSKGEEIPQEWATHGTTGYDFLNIVNGIFVDSDKNNAFSAVYYNFIGRRIQYDTLVNSAKKMIMLVSLPSEISALSHQLNRISERNRHYRDFTLDTLTFAVREVIASLRIYRTYIAGPDSVSERDRTYIAAAVADAKKRNPRTAESLFDFVHDTLILKNLHDFPESEHATLINWAMKFQQITGPVMAKGLEDTAFYIFNRLVSLNEVGGDPGRFGISVEEFHRHNQMHSERWPHSMLASTTHDTKRSEDVRARINVLSEMPEEWGTKLGKWQEMNASIKRRVDGESAPDPNDEYLFYQILVGSWPQGASGKQPPMPALHASHFRERIAAYMHKAIKEAKVHTSWVNPNREYDAAVEDFVLSALNMQGENAFLDDFLPFQKHVAHYGKINSLAQLLLKLTCPGVPDIYQGSELWDLRLVDPDNRGPIDYKVRHAILLDLAERICPFENGRRSTYPLKDLAVELLRESDDGRIKLYIIYRMLKFRRQHPEVFTTARYIPLDAKGIKERNVCAFSRVHASHAAIVAVPRLLVDLTDGSESALLDKESWKDTRLLLPNKNRKNNYRNLFTGEVLSAEENEGVASLRLSALFENFPVAVLEWITEGDCKVK